MALITMPSNFGVVRSDFRVMTAAAESESFATYQTQVYDWGGSRFEGEVTLRPYTYDDSADIRAFLMALKGNVNTFLYGDPDYLAKGPRGSGAGTPLVNGAAQTGETLSVDGFTPSATNVVRSGDYIQLGTGSSARLYGVIADANANGAGEADISLNRPLLNSPSDNSAVVITGAKGVFRLSERQVSWSGDESSVMDISIAFKEAL